MLNLNYLYNSSTCAPRLRLSVQVLAISFVFGVIQGCNQPDSATSAVSRAASLSNGSTGTVGTSSSGGSTSSSSTSSSINAVQIITRADPSGSFDAAAVPVAGGTSVKAQRIYNLDGSVITTGNVPTWYVESKLFLTSTRTSAGAPTYTTSSTPCAYFDTYSTDNNPETTGYYTIDGYNTEATGSDIDQCAGTAAAELNQLGMYVKIDRAFMNSTDRLQLIVKAKPLDSPNTAPTASSCVVGGFFDGSACSNQYFTVSMRSSPGAAAKPFYILFPSAKALDLLSESILLPINLSTNITTISVDRVKGGAIFYGLTVIRLQ